MGDLPHNSINKKRKRPYLAAQRYGLFLFLLSKKLEKYLLTNKINSNFASSFKKLLNMEPNIKIKVTAEEENLIMAIRNYCKSYPNGYPQLLEYAQDIFDRLTDMPK